MMESKTVVPEHFDYTGSNIMAHDVFMDNCPYAIPYLNGLCSDPKNVIQGQSVAFDEELGPRSRCFNGDYVKKSYAKTTRHFGCHTFECAKNEAGQVTVVINIGQSKVVCPPNGGNVPIPGYVGTIECPKESVFCAIEYFNECFGLNFCSGVGKCWGGPCLCPRGVNPRDCS
eukprot:TRINITY_DN19553_c0_g1_i1.p1 TRINITY_DN19553_c0_g1~~TRINITY_DN19553_c0_g1_i1.p1  ORF type:complete len:172 (+),score=16.06 TRINITY_DN19553_c0_g1_i1:250-765(+)